MSNSHQYQMVSDKDALSPSSHGEETYLPLSQPVALPGPLFHPLRSDNGPFTQRVLRTSRAGDMRGLRRVSYKYKM